MSDTGTSIDQGRSAADRRDDEGLAEQARQVLEEAVDDLQDAFGLGADPDDTIDAAVDDVLEDMGVTDTDGTWGVELDADGLDVGGDGTVTMETAEGPEITVPVRGQVHVDPIDVPPVLPGTGQLTGQAGPDGFQLDGTYDSGTGLAGDMHADEDGLDVSTNTPGGMGTGHVDENGADGGWVGDDGSTGSVSVDEGGLDAEYDPEGDGKGSLSIDERGVDGTWENEDGTLTGHIDEDGASGTWEGDDNTTTIDVDEDGIDAETKGTWGDPNDPESGYGTYEGEGHLDEDGLDLSGRADGHWEGEIWGAPVGVDGGVEGDLTVGGGEADGHVEGEGTLSVGGREVGAGEGSLDGHYGDGALDLGGEGQVELTGNYGGVPMTGSVDGSGDAHVDGDGYDVEGNVGVGLDTPIIGGQDVHGSIGFSAEGSWDDAGDSAQGVYDDAEDTVNDVTDGAQEEGQGVIDSVTGGDGNPFD